MTANPREGVRSIGYCFSWLDPTDFRRLTFAPPGSYHNPLETVRV